MAMGGLRDISVLDEAPIDRIPIQTYVLEEDDLIINEAIRRELRRGGQVFYMHNFVDSIYAVAARLGKAFLDAKITVAHGKMDKEELEEIWGEMLRGEIDILVSTTIIETGIDIPNANTLIVDNAHRLGLSQLHQIRGRVGRSSRRAYAYFTYPKHMALTEIAQKRLEAVREYAEFGAGFKIAMRDLELRGAGNMLGAEQHGHLDAVGYDLYIKLLNEAVLEEKGEKVEEKQECLVNLNFNAFIPEKYVTFSSQRMGLYKRIALIENEYDRLDIMDEMIDRYGDLPKPAENLLMIALIRANALKCKITSISQDGTEFKIIPAHIDIDVWSEVEENFDGKMKIILSSKPYISIRPNKNADALKSLNRALEKYVEIESRT
jgi:transcription-repair coupling factor (superfamily II helicase)